MKRLILGLAAAACVAGPIALSAAPAAAQNWDRREHRQDRWDRRDDRRDHRWERRDERWDRRGDYRDQRWDHSRYNGYYYRNSWRYGPPPAAYYNDPYYRPGYVSWRRGAYLPSYYQSYRVYDYGRYRLRPPPRGYYWYRVGNDYLLAAVATGLIFDVISNSY